MLFSLHSQEFNLGFCRGPHNSIDVDTREMHLAGVKRTGGEDFFGLRWDMSSVLCRLDIVITSTRVVFAARAIAAEKLLAVYLNIALPASSTFHARISATSPGRAISMRYRLPSNSRTSRGAGNCSG